MAEFDRANPLFERNSVPFEIIAAPNTQGSAPSANKRHGNFTVRILQGHRPPKNGGGEKERVIRFEMSDECNLFDENIDLSNQPSPFTPGRRASPNIPIIHAPFMTADRGRSQPMMQAGHQHGYPGSASNGFGLPPKVSQSIPNRPIELYELEVGESDFSDLRRDQALLVDFENFANSLISLLQLCELGEGGDSVHPQEPIASQQSFGNTSHHGQRYHDSTGAWNGLTSQPLGHQRGGNNFEWSTPQTQQQHSLYQEQHGLQYQFPRTTSPYGGGKMPVSTYTCRLETNYSPSSDDGLNWRNAQKSSLAVHARMSIVESNQFRELTHLALNLNVGTDKSVRLYLSLRLGQTMMQHRSMESCFQDQQRRSDAAETELIGLNKRLQDLSHSSEAEKSQIRCQAEERLQTEHCSRQAEEAARLAAKDAEIKALREQKEKNQAVLEQKIRLLEDTNAKINSEKIASQQENERLTTKLSFAETTNNTRDNELNSMRSQLQRVSDEKAKVESSLHQLQLQLSSLEFSSSNQERTIHQTEEKRISAEKSSADAKQTISRQQTQMEALRRRHEEAENEAEKYKDLTQRYQTNRAEMKKNLKDKAQMIRDQEDLLLAKEKEATELKQRVRGLEEKLHQTQREKESASRELNVVKRQMKDANAKLENNQQVIAWLNKQMGKSSNNSGAIWQDKETTNSAAARIAHPAPAAAANTGPSSRRFSSHAAFATPSPYVKPVTQLHPEPTPFLQMPRHPGASKQHMG